MKKILPVLIFAIVIVGAIFGARQLLQEKTEPAPPVASASLPKPAATGRTAIGIATWPGFAPSFLARERGYFGDLSVTIDVVDDFSARRAAFESGNHDFTIYTIDSLAFDAGKGLQGQIVLVLDESRGADGIVSKTGQPSPADTRGKSIAYTRGSPAHFFLVKYLETLQLKISDIKTVEVDDPTRAAEAFLSGTVPFAVTWEPYLSQIAGQKKGVILADTRTTPGLIVDVLVASPTVIRDRPEVVRQIVSGWVNALAEIAQPRADTITIMAKGLGMPEAEFRSAAAGVAFADATMNKHWLTRPAAGLSPGETLFAEAANVWKTEGLSDSPNSALPFFAPQFEPAVAAN